MSFAGQVLGFLALHMRVFFFSPAALLLTANLSASFLGDERLGCWAVFHKTNTLLPAIVAVGIVNPA